MKRIHVVLVILVLIPSAAAQNAHPPGLPLPPDTVRVDVRASNQRVDLSWEKPEVEATSYIVYVYQNGAIGENQNRTVNATQVTFFLTNGVTYIFEVAILRPDGTQGPRSQPVAATPHLENDLAYLASGLIAVWVGIFGYAAFLARKEASIDRKLEQLLQARFQGRSP